MQKPNIKVILEKFYAIKGMVRNRLLRASGSERVIAGAIRSDKYVELMQSAIIYAKPVKANPVGLE